VKKDSLPIEFAGLQGKVDYICRVSSTEWSSSCPQCGGVPHKNGSYPDRFRMWTNANGKNKVMGWCRHCSYVWFPENSKPIDKQEFERWRREQIEVEKQRRADAERAIRNLQSGRPWEEYHLRVNEWAMAKFAERGIPKDYVHYWRLGLNTDYLVNGTYHSPALTIPVWQTDKSINNIKLRILNPKTDGDRYRNMFKVGMVYPFVAWGKGFESSECLVVEGEFKAMTTACALRRDKTNIEVIGVPGKNPSPTTLDVLDKFERIYICLDPDAEKEACSLAGLLGSERVRVVTGLKSKIDDLAVLNYQVVNDAIKYAKKLEEV